MNEITTIGLDIAKNVFQLTRAIAPRIRGSVANSNRAIEAGMLAAFTLLR